MKSCWKCLKPYVFATHLGLWPPSSGFLAQPANQLSWRLGFKIGKKSAGATKKTRWKLLRFMVFVFALYHFVASWCQTWLTWHNFFQPKNRNQRLLNVLKAAFSSQVSVKRGEPPAVQSQVPHSSILRISVLSDRSQLGPVLSYHLCKIHLAKVAAKERRNQSKFPNPDTFSKSSHTSCTHNFAAAVTFWCRPLCVSICRSRESPLSNFCQVFDWTPWEPRNQSAVSRGASMHVWSIGPSCKTQKHNKTT